MELLTLCIERSTCAMTFTSSRTSLFNFTNGVLIVLLGKLNQSDLQWGPPLKKASDDKYGGIIAGMRNNDARTSLERITRRGVTNFLFLPRVLYYHRSSVINHTYILASHLIHWSSFLVMCSVICCQEALASEILNQESLCKKFRDTAVNRPPSPEIMTAAIARIE